VILKKVFRFEASHILPKHPGKCSRLHGHSWVLHVFVEGKVNPETGFVMDYAVISDRMKPFIEQLDHHHLGTFNDDIFIKWMPVGIGLLPDFYPTSENLLWHIGARLQLPWSKLALEETCTSYAELTRGEFDAMQEAI